MKKRANVFSIIAFAFAILGLIMQMSMYVAQCIDIDPNVLYTLPAVE